MDSCRSITLLSTKCFSSTMVRTIFSAACKADKDLKYEEAVKTLNTLQTNAATLEKIRQSRDKYAHLNIPRMRSFAERLGIQASDMERLNVIHVSGTKGKGSTCAYCESILRHHGYKTGFFRRLLKITIHLMKSSWIKEYFKTEFFSSPHLVEVRERFCVDGAPLQREKFASYFWDVYNKLDKSKADHDGTMPNYFGFLTVMALHVFLQEQVDVAIVEVGIGGQFDSTNLFRKPVVCGVSSLGLDHTSILGSTVDKIAWHKAGIFKNGVPAFSVPQAPEAMKVIQERAQELGAILQVSPSLDQYSASPRLGIQGEVQAVNAALALQLCHTWMAQHKGRLKEDEDSTGSKAKPPADHQQNEATTQTTICDIPVAKPFPLTLEYLKGLENCRWLGRNQKLSWPGVTFYLDGAHTVESIQQCVHWFMEESEKESKQHQEVQRVLVFNTTGDRDTSLLMKPLLSCQFHSALFCPNFAYEAAMSADQTNNKVTKESQLGRCNSNKDTWMKLIQSNTSNDESTDIITNGQGLSSSNGTVQLREDVADVNMNSCQGDKTLQTFSSIEGCINWVQKRRPISDNGTNKSNSCNGHATENSCHNGRESENSEDQNDSVIKRVRLDGCEKGKHGNGTGKHIQVLITGSIHLVGGALRVLWDREEAGKEGGK